MPGDVKDYLTRKGVPFKEYAGSIEQAIPGTDVLYVTRIQKERFASEKEYLAASENYVVNFKTMSGAKQRMAVLHPLPRCEQAFLSFLNSGMGIICNFF